MDEDFSFLTPHHRAVRNFVVLELPRNHGRPLAPAQIAGSLSLDLGLTLTLLDDLERHLFFLVRDSRGNVSWAFPVTSEPTPHRLRFSTGERIFGACAEDAFTTAFVLGRLRKRPLEVEITTSCAHCGCAMHILVDERFRCRVKERDADPRLYMPAIDWPSFRGRNILDDM